MKASQLREDEHLGGTISIVFEAGSRFQGVVGSIDIVPRKVVTLGFDDFPYITLPLNYEVAVFWPDAPWKDMGISEEMYARLFNLDYNLNLKEGEK